MQGTLCMQYFRPCSQDNDLRVFCRDQCKEILQKCSNDDIKIIPADKDCNVLPNENCIELPWFGLPAYAITLIAVCSVVFVLLCGLTGYYLYQKYKARRLRFNRLIEERQNVELLDAPS